MLKSFPFALSLTLLLTSCGPISTGQFTVESQQCIPMLAELPVGCTYTYPNGDLCQPEISCDPLTCEVPAGCASTPEKGCRYESQTIVNGCIVECGSYVCDSAPSPKQ